jgi:hypothetical protein
MPQFPPTPKTSEHLLAQTAVLADSYKKGVPHRGPQIIEQGIGFIASGQVELPEHTEYQSHHTFSIYENGGIKKILKDSALPGFDKEDYLKVLSNPEKRELIKITKGYIEAYGEFAQIIEELGIANLPLDVARNHPNFLAHGGSEQVFVIEKPDDAGDVRKYAVRYGPPSVASSQLQNRNTSLLKTNNRMQTYARGKGIEGLEQCVAVSYNPSVLVSEFIEGKQLYEMSLTERKAIPDAHYEKLKVTIEEARKANIDIDYNPNNFIYSPDRGFTVLDYRDGMGNPNSEEYNLKEIEDLRSNLTTAQEITQN